MKHEVLKYAVADSLARVEYEELAPLIPWVDYIANNSDSYKKRVKQMLPYAEAAMAAMGVRPPGFLCSFKKMVRIKQDRKAYLFGKQDMESVKKLFK